MKFIKTTLAITAALVLSSCGYQYSAGTRSGVVQNVSKKGLICKTWKAEIALDGMRIRGNSTSTRGSNLMIVHIADGPLVQEFQKFEASGKRATIAYEQKIFQPPCQAESNYHASSIN